MYSIRPVYKCTPYLIVALLNTSCATVPYEKTASGILDDYVGKPFKAAILDFGPPDDVYSDGDGGRIFSYAQETNYYRPGVTINSSNTNFSLEPYGWDSVEGSFETTGYAISSPPRTVKYKKYLYLYIDQSGQIYHYLHNIKSKAEKRAIEQNENALIAGMVLGTLGIVIAALAVNPDLE